MRVRFLAAATLVALVIAGILEWHLVPQIFADHSDIRYGIFSGFLAATAVGLLFGVLVFETGDEWEEPGCFGWLALVFWGFIALNALGSLHDFLAKQGAGGVFWGGGLVLALAFALGGLIVLMAPKSSE